MGTPFEENPSLESIDTESKNPTVISDKTIELFSNSGLKIECLIRKGKYGAIYRGGFTDQFNANKFVTQFKYDLIHKKRRPEVGQKFAVKFIDIKKRKKLGVTDVEEAVQREIQTLMTTNFYAIIDLFFAIKLPKTEKWFLFLPLADGNLQTLMRRKKQEKESLSHDLSKTWIRTLLEGLKYLHEKGITHGLFKLSNILFFKTDNKIELKIADFVLSHIATEELNAGTEFEQIAVVEDRMADDLIDAYFVFTNIFKSTKFKNKESEDLANDCIQCLIKSDTEITSLQLLDSVLKSRFLSE